MKARLISLVAVLILWWVGSLIASASSVPSPSLVVRDFLELMREGDLPEAMRFSLKALLYGGGLSIGLGIPLGILMGVFRPLAQALEHYFTALYVIPMSAVVPLMVLWFGIDINPTTVSILTLEIPLTPRVVFILIFTIPVVVITCYHGAKDIPYDLVEVARAFRANRLQIFFKILIPHEIPFIITALRLGVGRSIQGMVVAELLMGGTGTSGVGTLIHRYSAALEFSKMLAIVLFIMLLGIGATAIVRWFENAIAPWRRGLVAQSGE